MHIDKKVEVLKNKSHCDFNLKWLPIPLMLFNFFFMLSKKKIKLKKIETFIYA